MERSRLLWIVCLLSILIILFSCNDDEILPPLKPQGVSAIAGEGQVTISWSNSADVASYNIYWSETAGLTTENGILISNIESPYNHTGRTFGTTYYYIVTSVNSLGEGPASEEVSATLIPTAPTNVSALMGGDKIIISWSDVFGAESYNIYWGESPGVTPTNGTRISNAASPYTHTNLTPGITYYYIVTAENETGESKPSVEVMGEATTNLIIAGFTFKVSTDSSNYYISEAFNLSWTEANNLCNQTGGHMVTIGNQQENDLVLAIQASEVSKPHVWIGFTDQVTEGNFVWVTGEPITYTNWFPGEPNDQLGEDYTIIHSTNHGNPGSWADQPNSVNRYPVILEID